MVYLSREKEHLRCLTALHHHLWQQKHANVLQSHVMYYSGNILCYTIVVHEGETYIPYFLTGHPKTSKKQDASLFVISLGCDEPLR